MATVGRIKDSKLLLAGGLRDDLPKRMQDLVLHHPLDGLYPTYKSLKYCKIAYATYNDITYRPITDWIISQGCTDVTNIAYADVLTMADSQFDIYDIIVLDFYAYTCSSNYITKAKSLADSGHIVIASGNDTTTNTFVSSYTTFANEGTYKVITTEQYPLYSVQKRFNPNYADGTRGATALQNGAIPLFIHQKHPDIIMGYMYEASAGGIFIFDQVGYSFTSGTHPFTEIIPYIAGRSRTTSKVSNYPAPLGYERGVFFGYGTSNLFTQTDLADMVTWPLANTASLVDGWYRIKKNSDTVEFFHSGYNINVTGSTTYTESFIFRTIGGELNSLDITFFTNNGHHNVPATIENLGNGVKRAYATYTTDPTDTQLRAIDFKNLGGNFDYIEFKDVVVEQKSFPNWYQDNSKIGYSSNNLEVPVDFNGWEEGTISVKFKAHTSDTVYDWAALWEWGNYSNPWTTDQIYMMRGNGWDSDKLSFYYRCYDGVYNSAVSRGYTGINSHLNKWLTIIASWRRDSVTRKVTIGFVVYDIENNVFLEASETTPNNITAIPTTMVNNKISLGSRGYGQNDGPNAMMKDFTVYDKSTSLEDLKKMATNSFSIDVNGDVRGFEINNTKDSSCYHFPLIDGYNDKSGIVTPVASDNLIQDEKGTWVGKSITNMAVAEGIRRFDTDQSYISLLNGTTLSRIGVEGTTPLGNNAMKYEIIADSPSTNTDHHYGINTADGGISDGSSILNNTFVFGIYVKAPKGHIIRLTIYNDWGVSGSYTAQSFTTTGRWQRLEKTYTFTAVNASPNVINFRLSYYNDELGNLDTGRIGQFFYVGDFSCYRRPYNYPFFYWTPADGRLTYNLYNSIGLKWNSDWTIIYKKIPISTYNHSLTAYNIESLGCNSNSVGGGYRWWGKYNGEDGLSLGGARTPFTSSEYFNTEQWVVVTHDATSNTLKVTWIFDNGKTYYRSGTGVAGGTENYFVNQYGYDFKLGGWDNGSPVNSYYRNLMVYKRLLSQTEIDRITLTQMSITGNNLIVDDVIEEVILN